jgi:glycosyltransferase involved in cell wall biosynthesis
MRLAVYTDYPYHRRGGKVYAERAFAIFLGRLRPSVERLVVLGRLSPPGGKARYPLGDAELVELPFYPKASEPLRVVPALARSLRPFWRALDDVDCVWVLGPHPLAIGFALMAAARRRRVVLGVRQDLPTYVRSRHPRRVDLRAMARMLEGAFRLLAVIFPVVVVGPELARKYRHSRAVLEIAVSLVSEAEIIPVDRALQRSYDGELRVLSVGRLEGEKNPLMMADVLARLNREHPRWRLIVCGEGELAEPLDARLAELGQSQHAVLTGYVPFGAELRRLYLDSHVLLHLSWTEGLPQVLLEAFAAGLPVVASDVGGIRAAASEAVMLVPPGDSDAAARHLGGVAADRQLRERMVGAGLAYVRPRTSEAELRRLARFLDGARR